MKTTGCVICGKYLAEGDGMVCKACQADADSMTSSTTQKNIHIENSYNVWSTSVMWSKISEKCYNQYGKLFAPEVLNRSYKDMYIEWYIHNIGYYLTLPFCKFLKIKQINERFKHVDLEEHL